MPAVNRRSLQPGERIRVMVVDDSVVIRRLVTHALEREPLIEVVGAASNGLIALQRIPQFRPDVITLDIEMPEMDGLSALRRIHKEHPHIRVIMFSTLTERGAAVTIEALTLGADEYVAKVSNEGSLDRSMSRLQEELVPRIRQFFRSPPEKAELSCPAAPRQSSVRPVTPSLSGVRRHACTSPRVVIIGVSTGGPTALGSILPHFPSDFPLPVLLVQHMPPLFTRLLAERLQASCRLKVSEATAGELVEPGKILVAPGDYHMRLVRSGTSVRVQLDQSEPLNSCRPAVDALFGSAAEVYEGAVIAAVLTGMGQDGWRGAERLKACGACVLAQDEASSVVWGMPGAIVNAGLADDVLPLDAIVPAIIRLAGRGQTGTEVCGPR